MNRAVQKYGPPLVVLGAALYLGWPPSRPMDLGENTVRVKSVRWKVTDLAPPQAPTLPRDPFSNQEKQAAAQVVVAPQGPSAAEVRAIVQLNGIMNLGGDLSAILNGKAYRIGETINLTDDVVEQCTLIAIKKDCVVVQCREAAVEIQPRRMDRTNRSKTSRPVPPRLPEVPPSPEMTLVPNNT